MRSGLSKGERQYWEEQIEREKDVLAEFVEPHTALLVLDDNLLTLVEATHRVSAGEGRLSAHSTARQAHMENGDELGGA